MERLRATPETQARKIEWLEQALAEGAHEKLPHRSITQECWRRQVGINLLYNVGSETTEESIGNLSFHKLTKERIRKIVESSTIYLHGNCSDETRAEFPLETIPFRKPWPQVSRERTSLAKGGISLKIKEEMDRGVSDPDKIAQNLGLNSYQIAQSRHVLKTWGINLA